ncbi:MAG TPA: glycerol-3-phosphate 1-O-acyltransferase PlsY [Candidatus Limnocylindrales bacterium]
MDTGDLIRALVVVVAGYLIGGIPWGVIVARLAGGPDPRTLGSGRTGGANVMRAIGPRLALVSGLLDMAKGIVAVLVARALGAGPAVEVLAGLAALIGHSRSPFLGFRGGRGVSAGYGALLVISPLAALATIPIFVGVVLLTRYSSLASLAGSLVAGVLLGGLTIVAPLPPEYLAYAIVGPLLIWLFHLDNIQRLLAGTERKIGGT